MRKISLVAAAVAASLAGTSAFALTPAQIAADVAAGTITIVNVTGSSAFRDQMFVTLQKVCAANKDVYGADASLNDAAGISRNTWDGWDPSGAAPFYSYNGPDFRAYSCTLGAAPAQAPALGAVAGTDILVYYRAEGGSVYGVAPLALNGKPMRLDIPNPAAVPAGEAACGQTQQNGVALIALAKSGFTTWICPVPSPLLNTKGLSGPGSDAGAGIPATGGWWLPYDNWQNTAANGGSLPAYAGNVDLVTDAVSMGVSDVEPAALTQLNYPANNLMGDGTALGTGLSAAQLATLTAVPVIQQGFGIIVSNNGTFTPTLTNLSKQTISAILTGKYTKWSQSPEGAGNNINITICRRDPGSGTQTTASIFYGNYYCGGGLEAGTAMKAGNGTTVLQYATTGDVQACVATHNDSIGISGGPSNPNGGHFVNVDGIAYSQANMLNGSYKEWYEVNYVKGSNFGSLSASQQALINGLIQGTSDAVVAGVAANSDYMYIPSAADSFGADNTASLANVAKFVNLTTRGGLSCSGTVVPKNNN
ncbi:MAG TPA: substrate-binding domain-containing protein [Steroidobacteraceae bacterium]|nr:substrate-binding domain-containing protein [Steroidobacteraceae bacterium]